MIPDGYYFVEIEDCPFLIAPYKPYLAKWAPGVELYVVRRDQFVKLEVTAVLHAQIFSNACFVPEWNMDNAPMVWAMLEKCVVELFSPRKGNPDTYPAPLVLAKLKERFFRQRAGSPGGLFFHSGVLPDAPPYLEPVPQGEDSPGTWRALPNQS